MSTDNNNYFDLHCHSALKPFGKSHNRVPIGQNSTYRNHSNSIWRYDPPTLLDKLINYLLHLTKFSQANFTSMVKGGVRVVCASLYPIERGFFDNAIKNEFLRDMASNFATGVGKKRVDAVQQMNDYFKDLELEYHFYRQLNKKVIKLPEGQFTYQLVRNQGEIEALQKNQNGKTTTIAVVLSIEGMHVLNSNLLQAPDEKAFLARVQQIKQWHTPPFFVTLAHHFWNHLCGHAESFTALVKKKVDQSEGLNTGLTPLGKKVIHALYDKSNGQRILIDVKHMSVLARQEFYGLLETDPTYSQIPIIVSHGAANGLLSPTQRQHGGSAVADKLNPVDINFFNDELVRIANRKGIIGLQLDERRIVNQKTLKATKSSTKRAKIMHYRSELLWYQIQHILEVLDSEGLFAWDCIALGTDFDGIIDALNGFWTAEELPYLADFLERHAYNHMKNAQFKVAANKIDADEIVDRVMSSNGRNFLRHHFI
jgi:microsomal dipeptidase-like Zn-dependent dipeptidase